MKIDKKKIKKKQLVQIIKKSDFTDKKGTWLLKANNYIIH